MNNIMKKIISSVLLLSMLFALTVPILAADYGEEYISELRLVYADDYEEAKEIISESPFKDYKILNENLNANSDEIGVWLAYKTTTNIDDAVTDLAIMQENGGYKDGNFQEMIRKSYSDYVALGEIYLEAIEYFRYALDEDDLLANMAYRQLNFYTVETQKDIGLKVPLFEGELLGDIFYEEGKINKNEIATMFLEGNSYALKNIRSLLAMGVSYNEDGKSYLAKVGDAALEMNEDPFVFEDEDYETLTSAIQLAFPGIQGILQELALYEDEFNYADGEFTAEELRYLEVKAIADTMREIAYLDGQTLYEFFMDYDESDHEDDPSRLYPLAAALNDGQVAMTKVSHYYDVIRYSCVTRDADIAEEELDALEEIYGDNPFNIYTGVDRTLYQGTFALTTAADRADAYSEIDMMNELLKIKYDDALEASILTGSIGIAMLGLSAVSRYMDIVDHKEILAAYNDSVAKAGNAVANKITNMSTFAPEYSSYFVGANGNSYGTVVDALYHAANGVKPDAAMSFTDKLDNVYLYNMQNNHPFGNHYNEWLINTKAEVAKAKAGVAEVSATAPVSFSTGLFFAVGGVLTLFSAYMLISSVHNYYHRDFADVPLAMVDLVRTVDGDRYIKYDVVYNAETNDDGIFEAADLNAFAGKNWNALYYTKSYEAGKALLADSFSVSYTNNKPKTNYSPVHRFGEVVCYDLNKYNFEGDTNIYLSVKQSKNDKSAVADVPEIVGSAFSAGYLVLAGGVGIALGVGGTIGTQWILRKKKAGAYNSDDNDDTPSSPAPDSSKSAVSQDESSELSSDD